VTEGEDKPLKYPHMFRAASTLIINKIDLLPYVEFNLGRAIEYAHAVNPEIDVLIVSARSGEGMQGWYEWLHREAIAARALTVS
jgi:hydrogenase nickel incorporation protein HypB